MHSPIRQVSKIKLQIKKLILHKPSIYLVRHYYKNTFTELKVFHEKYPFSQYCSWDSFRTSETDTQTEYWAINIWNRRAQDLCLSFLSCNSEFNILL